MRTVYLGVLLVALSGCKHRPANAPASSDMYTPVAPLALNTCGENGNAWLNVLPNETSQVTVVQNDGSGSVSYGPATVVVVGHSYKVLVDYILYTTTTMPTRWSRSVSGGEDQYYFESPGNRFAFRIKEEPKGIGIDPKQAAVTVVADVTTVRRSQDEESLVAIPVYVGIGFRLEADVVVTKGTVNIGSVSALGVAATAGHISGSLAVQRIGIQGNNVPPVPIPNEISTSTIQSVLQA